jgi:hypothetical protein
VQLRKALTVIKPLQDRFGVCAYTVGRGGFMKKQLHALRTLGLLLVTSLVYGQTIWMLLSM